MNKRDRGAPLSLIGNLANKDSAVRQRAAAAIFALGRRQALLRVEKWLRDPEIAPLFLLSPSGSPAITVGIAVESRTFERIRAANGSPRLAEVPPDIDARELELRFPDDVRIDVLTTRDGHEDGAITRFLKKFGEGIQQVEIEVKDAERATALLRERLGLLALYPKARSGADDSRVNFLLVPDDTGAKLLIELVEFRINKST